MKVKAEKFDFEKVLFEFAFEQAQKKHKLS